MTKQRGGEFPHQADELSYYGRHHPYHLFGRPKADSSNPNMDKRLLGSGRHRLHLARWLEIVMYLNSAKHERRHRRSRMVCMP
jgi:hypothetical protein